MECLREQQRESFHRWHNRLLPTTSLESWRRDDVVSHAFDAGTQLGHVVELCRDDKFIKTILVYAVKTKTLQHPK